MKKFTTFIVIFLCAISLFAQAPQKFTYQAVVRNANNQLVTEAPVSVRVSVLQGSAYGSVVYVETHTSTTNINGLLTLEIGEGSAVQGNMAAINWGDGPYFLKTEIDPAGGINYSITSTQQLLSVPYALYAKEAANSFSGDYNDLTNTPQIPQVPTNVSAFNNDAGYITAAQVPAQVNADWDATTGVSQILNKPTNVSAFNNDAGYITMDSVPVIPTNVSAFANDAGYITMDSVPAIPANVSAFTNDAGYITAAQVPAQVNADWNATSGVEEILNKPTNVSVFNNDAGYITNADIPVIPTVPDSVSVFINDAGYITAAQVPAQVNADWNATTGVEEILNKPTNVSAFTNDAGYLNQADFTNLANMISTLNSRFDSLRTVIDNQNAEMGRMNSQIDSLSSSLPSGNDNCCTALGNTIDSLQHQLDALQQIVAEHHFICGTSTVTDHEGNVYHTVKIGNQCWTKENLRTTTSPSTGTYLIPVAGTDWTYTGKQAYWYNNDSTTYAPMNYGLLYNWNAAVDTFNTAFGETSVNWEGNNAVSVTFNGHRRGICPAGWHLPSDAEWTALTDYVSGQSEYLCDSNTNYIAKALADSVGWVSFTGTCAVGDNQSANNATGFSAVPAGGCDGSSFFYLVGGATWFWSATQAGSASACSRLLDVTLADVNVLPSIYKFQGFSVRCLRDETGGGGSTAVLPTVTTSTVSSITATSATSGGNVTADGGATVTARGVCWSTSQNPTVSDSHTTDGSGTGSFTSNLTGLTANTTYYVRAYATNSVGTAYGEHRSFTTTSAPSFICGTSTVSDHEGNVYATVQIGNQCWMRDNLRTTTSPTTGAYLIPAADANYTFTGKQARWYDNDSTTYAPMNYGLLYNWNAAVDTFNTAYGETSVNQDWDYNNAVSVTFNGHRRGICPAGWHLPSDAEWTALTDYVSGQSEYLCDSNTYYIAKALADSVGWNIHTNQCAVGNNQSANNATGFSAVPAGAFVFFDLDSFVFGGAGGEALFWSATQFNNNSNNIAAYHRLLSSATDGMNALYNLDIKASGLSVRCLRD